MILLTILSIIGVVLILLSYKIKIPTGKGKTLSLTIPAFILGIVFIGVGVMSTSLVNPDSNSIGIKKKIYGTAELTGGQIIATNGEKGLQADIVQPGFQIIPLINVFYDVEEIDIFEVPAGHLGVLVAKDGIKLRDGQYIADSWKDLYKGKNSYDMINPVVFLKNGGQAGPQMDVLKPGKYKLNTHLWKVTLAKATKVKPGHVMVIKSNAGDANDKSCISDKRPTDGATLTSPLVKEGCFGVWDTPKYPGNYYLNPTAYEAHIVPTQLFTWTYKGGYMIQDVAIERNEKGEMKIVKGEKVNVPIPQGAADGAIQALSKDAHEFNTEWSIQAQVKPEDAPFLIASIGSIANAEDRVVTPLARSVVRNNSEKVNGDAFIGKREQIESDLEKTIIPEGKKVGITIRDARLRSPGMPPELKQAIKRRITSDQTKIGRKYTQEDMIKSMYAEMFKHAPAPPK